MEALCPTERRVLVESLVVLATPFAADGARTTHDCTNQHMTDNAEAQPNADMTPPGRSCARRSFTIIHTVPSAAIPQPMYTISCLSRLAGQMIGLTLNRCAMRVIVQ